MKVDDPRLSARIAIGFSIMAGLCLLPVLIGLNLLEKISAAGLIDMAPKVGQGATLAYHSVLILSAMLPILCAVGLTIWLTRSIVRPLQDAIVIAETVASGDLSQEFESQHAGEFGRLLQGLANMENKLTEIVTEITTTIDSIAQISDVVSTGNSELSCRTEEQAVSLQKTAATMEELTVRVKRNAKSAQDARQLAISTSTLATRGGDDMAKLAATMRAINESSREVNDIVVLIEGIAFQTNILALNAAVEAARAGDAGRGFAVVANEVRVLAHRSSTAAKEIKTLIEESSNKVIEGSERVVNVECTINDVIFSTKKVNELLADIDAASMEQTIEIEQIHHTVAQIDRVTQRNAALVDEATSSAMALQSQVRNLSTLVSTFKL